MYSFQEELSISFTWRQQVFLKEIHVMEVVQEMMQTRYKKKANGPDEIYNLVLPRVDVTLKYAITRFSENVHYYNSL